MINRCHLGDCRDVMRMLAAAGVRAQTCVTSPPYWGLRDYGVDGQIGLEPTIDEFIDSMVAVFRCVRDVLADDGTLWLNMGDGYAGAPGGGQGKNGQRASRTFTARIDHVKRGSDLKPKDLVGTPWMLAFALRADGWYLRQDIIWHKPNPMPESVTDRCTKAHEYIFLLSKSERYFYDAEAIKEKSSDGTHARLPGNKAHKGTAAYDAGDESHRTKGGLVEYAQRQRSKRLPSGWDTGPGGHREKTGRYERDVGIGSNARPRKAAPNGSGTKNNASFDEAMAVMPEYRNKRSVWTVPTFGFSEAHFATFPPDLIKPCILAGSRPGDIVLDPFMGSGTTGMVAHELGRQWVGAELNPEYLAMQQDRIRQGGLGL